MNIPYKNWDDYYGLCAEGLCIAAQKYNSSKSKFSTLAMDIMEKKVIDEIRKNHCVKRGNGNQYIELDEGNVIYDSKDKFYEFEQNAITRYQFSEFQKLLNDREKKILLLIYKGYSYGEIAGRLHISKAAVGKSIKKVRRLYVLNY